MRVTSQSLGARVQSGGMHPALMQKLMREGNPGVVLIEALLLTSQLARMARTESEGVTNYDVIHRAAMYNAVRQLLTHTDAPVRARACNLIGALCRGHAY